MIRSILCIIALAGAVNAMDDKMHLLHGLLTKAAMFPEEFLNELRTSEFAAIAPTFTNSPTASSKANSGFPVVFAHGMGDSCFNSGMESITKAVGVHVGAYSVCIPTGDTQAEDTMNGFLMSMNKNVDVFAAKVKADAELAHGFNAIGFSQGNSIIRGYIQKYNNPPVVNHLSVHGTIMGVGSLPQCNPTGGLKSICQSVTEILGDLAYNEVVQNLLFQAGYFRDPTKTSSAAYLANSAIADWNNEGKNNTEYNTNFAKTQKFITIKALGDTMVFPNEAEWWGSYAEGAFVTQTMNETKWYTEDLFGLRSAAEANKLFFNTTTGNHLQFTDAQLYSWIDQHF